MEKITIQLTPFYIARLEEIASAMTAKYDDGDVWDLDDTLFNVISSGLLNVEKEFGIDARNSLPSA